MSVTQADLDNLDRMIVSGVLMTFYDGKKVEYRSMADLRTARSMVASQLAQASGTALPASYAPVYSKGV